MFRWYLDPSRLLLFAPPDGPTGGAASTGSAEPAAPAGGEPGASDGGTGGDADPDPAAAAAAGADDARGDDDLDDGDADDREIDTLPEQNLRTRLRRAQRQLRAAQPILERFRGPDHRFLDTRSIDGLVNRARDMEELEGFFNEHPDVLQTILEKKNGKPTAAATAAARQLEDAFQDPYTDLDGIPFDHTDPSGKWFLNEHRNHHKAVHDLRGQIKSLESKIAQLTQNDQTRSVGQVEAQWKHATLTEVNRVFTRPEDEPTKQLVVNAVWRAFELAKRDGSLRRLNPRTIVERTLAPFVRGKNAARRSEVAGAQRRADGNTTRPQPTRGPAAPAGPEATNRVGTIRDGRKSFFARAGMTAPPR